MDNAQPGFFGQWGNNMQDAVSSIVSPRKPVRPAPVSAPAPVSTPAPASAQEVPAAPAPAAGPVAKVPQIGIPAAGGGSPKAGIQPIGDLEKEVADLRAGNNNLEVTRDWMKGQLAKPWNEMDFNGLNAMARADGEKYWKANLGPAPGVGIQGQGNEEHPAQVGVQQSSAPEDPVRARLVEYMHLPGVDTERYAQMAQRLAQYDHYQAQTQMYRGQAANAEANAANLNHPGAGITEAANAMAALSPRAYEAAAQFRGQPPGGAAALPPAMLAGGAGGGPMPGGGPAPGVSTNPYNEGNIAGQESVDPELKGLAQIFSPDNKQTWEEKALRASRLPGGTDPNSRVRQALAVHLRQQFPTPGALQRHESWLPQQHTGPGWDLLHSIMQRFGGQSNLQETEAANQYRAIGLRHPDE